jgi:hypothetical protein
VLVIGGLDIGAVMICQASGGEGLVGVCAGGEKNLAWIVRIQGVMRSKDLWRRKVVLWGTNPSILWIFFDRDHGERVMDVDMAELQESGWTMDSRVLLVQTGTCGGP